MRVIVSVVVVRMRARGLFLLVGQVVVVGIAVQVRLRGGVPVGAGQVLVEVGEAVTVKVAGGIRDPCSAEGVDLVEIGHAVVVRIEGQGRIEVDLEGGRVGHVMTGVVGGGRSRDRHGCAVKHQVAGRELDVERPATVGVEGCCRIGEGVTGAQGQIADRQPGRIHTLAERECENVALGCVAAPMRRKELHAGENRRGVVNRHISGHHRRARAADHRRGAHVGAVEDPAGRDLDPEAVTVFGRGARAHDYEHTRGSVVDGLVKRQDNRVRASAAPDRGPGQHYGRVGAVVVSAVGVGIDVEAHAACCRCKVRKVFGGKAAGYRDDIHGHRTQGRGFARPTRGGFNTQNSHGTAAAADRNHRFHRRQIHLGTSGPVAGTIIQEPVTVVVNRVGQVRLGRGPGIKRASHLVIRHTVVVSVKTVGGLVHIPGHCDRLELEPAAGEMGQGDRLAGSRVRAQGNAARAAAVGKGYHADQGSILLDQNRRTVTDGAHGQGGSAGDLAGKGDRDALSRVGVGAQVEREARHHVAAHIEGRSRNRGIIEQGRGSLAEGKIREPAAGLVTSDGTHVQVEITGECGVRKRAIGQLNAACSNVEAHLRVVGNSVSIQNLARNKVVSRAARAGRKHLGRIRLDRDNQTSAADSRRNVAVEAVLEHPVAVGVGPQGQAHLVAGQCGGTESDSHALEGLAGESSGLPQVQGEQRYSHPGRRGSIQVVAGFGHVQDAVVDIQEQTHRIGQGLVAGHVVHTRIRSDQVEVGQRRRPAKGDRRNRLVIVPHNQVEAAERTRRTVRVRGREVAYQDSRRIHSLAEGKRQDIPGIHAHPAGHVREVHRHQPGLRVLGDVHALSAAQRVAGLQTCVAIKDVRAQRNRCAGSDVAVSPQRNHHALEVSAQRHCNAGPPVARTQHVVVDQSARGRIHHLGEEDLDRVPIADGPVAIHVGQNHIPDSQAQVTGVDHGRIHTLAQLFVRRLIGRLIAGEIREAANRRDEARVHKVRVVPKSQGHRGTGRIPFRSQDRDRHTAEAHTCRHGRCHLLTERKGDLVTDAEAGAVRPVVVGQGANRSQNRRNVVNQLHARCGSRIRVAELVSKRIGWIHEHPVQNGGVRTQRDQILRLAFLHDPARAPVAAIGKLQIRGKDRCIEQGFAKDQREGVLVDGRRVEVAAVVNVVPRDAQQHRTGHVQQDPDRRGSRISVAGIVSDRVSRINGRAFDHRLARAQSHGQGQSVCTPLDGAGSEGARAQVEVCIDRA